MVDFALSAEQQALRDTVRRWARHVEPRLAAQSPADVTRSWRELAGLGVLGLGRDPDEGGAVELLVAMRELGQVAYPGPLIACVVAHALLDDERRTAVADGTSLASLVTDGFVPDQALADVVILVEDQNAWEVRVRGVEFTVDTAIGETWTRGDLERVTDLGDSRRARTIRDIAAAGYLTGAARHQLSAAGTYAETRTQFGQHLIDFQAVAHPISDAAVDVLMAESLAAVAAARHDDTADTGEAGSAAVLARVTASKAALRATYVAHQAMGAIGYALEGPLARHTLHIRQQALSIPISDTDQATLDAIAGLRTSEYAGTRR